jgi:ferredoxin
MHVVTLSAQGWSFAAADDVTVLEAARLSGILLPSSCRNGSCRTCMCRLDSGEIQYRIAWPGLSAEEKREGFILPCVAYAMSDLVVADVAARLHKE